MFDLLSFIDVSFILTDHAHKIISDSYYYAFFILLLCVIKMHMPCLYVILINSVK